MQREAWSSMQRNAVQCLAHDQYQLCQRSDSTLWKHRGWNVDLKRGRHHLTKKTSPQLVLTLAECSCLCVLVLESSAKLCGHLSMRCCKKVGELFPLTLWIAAKGSPGARNLRLHSVELAGPWCGTIWQKMCCDALLESFWHACSLLVLQNVCLWLAIRTDRNLWRDQHCNGPPWRTIFPIPAQW